GFAVDYATLFDPLRRSLGAAFSLAGSLRQQRRSKEERVSSELSVAQVLANLEAQMKSHRDQEEHHASREAHHREQRAVHAAELETIARHYEAFKATAGSAA